MSYANQSYCTGGDKVAFKQAQKITLTDLDNAVEEYESLLKQTEKTYAAWDEQKTASFDSISEVEALAASINHASFTIGKKLKKLTVKRESYKNRVSIEREKRKDDIAAGVGSLAVLGAGAAAAVSFWDYVSGFVSKKTNGKIGKNALVWLIVACIILVAGLILLVCWAFNRWKTAQKAIQNTKRLRKLIGEYKKKEADAATLTEELKVQTSIVDQYLDTLSQYAGMLYKDIPSDSQKFLVLMINEAILLSEIMEKESK